MDGFHHGPALFQVKQIHPSDGKIWWSSGDPTQKKTLLHMDIMNMIIIWVVSIVIDFIVIIIISGSRTVLVTYLNYILL